MHRQTLFSAQHPSVPHICGITEAVLSTMLLTVLMDLKFPQTEAVSRAQVSTLQAATPLVLTGTSTLLAQLARAVSQSMEPTVFSVR